VEVEYVIHRHDAITNTKHNNGHFCCCCFALAQRQKAAAEAEFATNYKEELIDLSLGTSFAHAPKYTYPAMSCECNVMEYCGKAFDPCKVSPLKERDVI